MDRSRRDRRSVWTWLAGSWLVIALILAATLLANGALIFADTVATTCSDYVPEFPDSPLDLTSAFHQCHHVLGLEIPTQWNPVLAIGFGLLAGVLLNFREGHTTPPAPEAG